MVGRVDLRGDVGVATNDQRLPDAVGELRVRPVLGEGRPPGRFGGPESGLTVEAGVGDEPDDFDRRAGGAEEDRHAFLDAVGLEDLVGPCLAVGGGTGTPSGSSS